MKKKSEPYALLLPTIILFAFVIIMPLLLNIYYSFCDMDYMKFDGYVGFKYYLKFLEDKSFYKSLQTTLFISLTAVSISMTLGTLMALWIDKKDGVLAYLIKLVGLVPWAISMVVASLLWKWIFNGEFGLLNYILSLFGIDSINIFATKLSAKFAVIFVLAWRTLGVALFASPITGIQGDGRRLVSL